MEKYCRILQTINVKNISITESLPEVSPFFMTSWQNSKVEDFFPLQLNMVSRNTYWLLKNFLEYSKYAASCKHWNGKSYMKFIKLGVEPSTSFVNVCFTLEVTCMFMCYQNFNNSFKFNCLSFPKTQQSFGVIDLIYAHCSQNQLKSWPKFYSFLFAWEVQICKEYIQVPKIWTRITCWHHFSIKPIAKSIQIMINWGKVYTVYEFI